ncbi:MFS transporter [Desulfovibrio cuneatus]|uniref:MFS transporter n=1 Tax=Desulfovibrio cuneatus TaxID=159728 RepID=UPI00040DCD86|nr:MFS transporter [Desulfovibrio cuneatus]
MHLSPLPPHQTRLVVQLGFSQIMGWGASYYLPALLAAPMAQAMGISPSMVFTAFTLGLVVTALAGPVAGRAVDTYGGRTLLVISNIVLAAALVSMAWATGPVSLCIAWLFMGAGMSIGLFETAFATVVQLHEQEAPAIISGITLVAGFASTISWPLTAFFHDHLGWQGTLYMWAGIQLAIALPLNYLLPEPTGRTPSLLPRPKRLAPLVASSSPVALPPTAPGPAPQPSPAQTTLQPHPTPATPPHPAIFPLLAFAFMLTSFTATAMAAHMPALLVGLGATQGAALWASMLIGPAQVAGRLFQVVMLRGKGALPTAIAAAMGHPLGILTLWLGGVAAIFPFSILHGLGNGIITIVKGALPLELYGAEGYGLRIGWLLMPARFAQALAPMLFSMAITVPGNFALLLSGTCGLLAALTFVGVRGLHKTAPKNAEDPS